MEVKKNNIYVNIHIQSQEKCINYIYRSNDFKTLESGYYYLPIIRIHTPLIKKEGILRLTIENISFLNYINIISLINYPEKLVTDLDITLKLLYEIEGFDVFKCIYR